VQSDLTTFLKLSNLGNPYQPMEVLTAGGEDS